MAGKNAIEKRLEYLANCWNDFVQDDKARLLRWFAGDDDRRVLEVFFETQNEEGASEIPDLFLQFEAPFEDPRGYGFQLIERLRSDYEHDREELGKEGIDAAWQCPVSDPRMADYAAFLECCRSFQRHYQDAVQVLAVVLRPGGVSSARDLQVWLYNLLSLGVPGNIRFTFPDPAEQPLLADLARKLPELVSTVELDLDMPSAMLEIVRVSGNRGPGADFQRLFLEVAHLAPAGRLDLAKRKAEQAIEITKQQQWPSLETAMRMLLAGVHFGGGRNGEAIAEYRLAAQAAAAALEKKEPAAAKLVLQARFGEAAVLVGDQKFAEAAQVYGQSVAAALEAADDLMVLEAWRMAGYCHEQARAAEAAWSCNWQALAAAEKLDEATRRNSTLPYVGQALLRIARLPQYQPHIPAIHERMAALAGEDWDRGSTTGAAGV